MFMYALTIYRLFRISLGLYAESKYAVSAEKDSFSKRNIQFTEILNIQINQLRMLMLCFNDTLSATITSL